MKRTLSAAVVVGSVLAMLASGCTSLESEPTRQPPSSSVPTVTTTTPSATSVPTATTTTPSATPGDQVTAGPVRTPPAGVTEGGPGATGLSSLGFCDPDSPGTAAMALTWRSARAGEQLVAISTRPDGFETGRYTVSENLPATQEQYTVSPVEPGGVYYWRVLTRSGQGWIASQVATFTGPTCVVDAS